MGLKIYDTKTKRKEEFHPAGQEVGMYVCGPTVYDYAHLGHAKAYVTFDVLRRYLEYKGWRTVHVQNFTDVEDSITNRAKEEGVPPLTLAERFIEAFLEDMDRLKIRRAHHYPRVSDHVGEMVRAIQELVDRGLAYEVDGEVLLRVPDDSFGALSGRSVEEIVVDTIPEDPRRQGPLDFALWKKAKEGEPSWPSPWGNGRPGWHVECYVMSTKYLGPAFDIHGGGMDLIFPHHESEDLISQALGKGEFARHWFHNGFMTLRSEPMSKSLGNFVTIRETLGDYDWEVLRCFILKTHYRATTDYSPEALREAKGEHAEVAEAIQKVRGAAEVDTPGEDLVLLKRAGSVQEAFLEAMDDDLDTGRATEALLGLARTVNMQKEVPTSAAKSLLASFCEFCSILGLCEEELDD